MRFLSDSIAPELEQPRWLDAFHAGVWLLFLLHWGVWKVRDGIKHVICWGADREGQKVSQALTDSLSFRRFCILNCLFLLLFLFACLFWIESPSVAQASRKLTVYLRQALNSLQFSCLSLLSAGILDLGYYTQFTQSGNQTQGFLHAGWALCQRCQTYPQSSLFLPLNKRMQVPK